MIGVIVTGHSDFSTGMKNALEMIAGEQAAFEAVPFLNGESTDTFEARLRSTIETLKQENESLIVLADLVGGTPYKAAATLLHEDETARVIGGTNLALALELLMMRFSVDDLDTFVNQVLAVGSVAIGVFQRRQVDEVDVEEAEGI